MPASGVLTAVHRGILHAVAYADVFDYPLTAAEVRRYLVGHPASFDRVRAELHNLVPDWLAYRDGYFTLAGREGVVDTRRRRAGVAARLWREAVQCGRLIAGFSFVRMVAVTGSLAMDNADEAGDIDYLIVTEPGRVWIGRALAGGLGRLCALRGGARICANYVLAERVLRLDQRNLYTAHELTQMVPIAGFDTYRRMRRLNGWTRRFLPNAGGPPRYISAAAESPGRAMRVAEAALRSPAGGWLDRLERARKVRKTLREATTMVEIEFDDDRFKGHAHPHGQRILAAFADRVGALEGLME